MDQVPKGKSALADRNFRILTLGSFVSMMGDQFTLVALPWLVLKLTGDAAALGLVLAAMALPRAAFMLIGGAVVDRLSPKRVLVVARAANAVMIGVLAFLVVTGRIDMNLLYALAFGIGLSTAFVYPAGSAILPQILEPDQLRSGNGVVMGLRQLSMFVGPALAGAVVTLGSAHGHPSGVDDARGIGIAFTVDAISFLFSLASLLIIHVKRPNTAPPSGKHVFADVAVGLRAVWNDHSLRAFVLYVAVVSIFVGGPIQVGLPVLADHRLDWGAAAFGILIASNGAGTILGAILSGKAVGWFGRGRLGLMVLTFDALVGLSLAAMALVHVTLVGAALMVLVGVLAGIVQISIFTWIQQRVAPEMMGRTMSVLMFVFMGLGPISAAGAGALLKVISLPTLFTIAGLALSGIALLAMSSRGMREIGMPLPAAAPDN